MPFRILPVLLFCFPFFICAKDREAWTASKIQGSPEPPPPYIAEAIWPHITFNDALDITLLESENRLFVTERFGRIWALPADLKAHPDKPERVEDLKSVVPNLNNLLGLAFHPEFQRNREVFLYYNVTLNPEQTEVQLSRFKVDDGLRFIPGSKEILIRFIGAGHMGGDLQFGPDGLLYFPVGDLAPPSPPDPHNHGQNLGTLASAISRIDVDRKDPGLPYRIPEDNPFVGMVGARPEIWAYGFRNPWKICFHPESGEIWTGDVGWEMWEMVYRVEKGNNYGWSIMEGPVPNKMDQPKGPTPISPPAVYYSHIEGASVTGGYFVTGSRLPDLQGSYVYGDYVTGKVWALDWNGNRVANNRLIAETRKQIVTFGLDPQGDLLFLDFPEDQHLYRLIPNPEARKPSDFPQLLSETGVFEDVKNEEPSPGVYAFTIQAPTWQDGFRSRYWLALPGKAGIKTEAIDRRGSPLIRYQKPKDMVLVKTIHKDDYRVETQILHWDGYWNGYTYQWNQAQTDATLVRNEGLDTTVLGKPYRFPGRAECIRCHGSNFNRPLAFFPGQMNRDGQLEQFLELGLIDRPFVSMAKRQPLIDPTDNTAPIEERARSWLHSNCSHCHRVSGGSGTTVQMNVAVPSDQLYMVNTPPLKGGFGLENAPLIEPGNPYRSILYYRMATKGAGHMPMIGPKTLDQEGIRLIHDWIRSLDPQAPVPRASQTPKNVEEALALYHKLQSGALSESERKDAISACLKSTDPFVINLFAGFALE